MKKFLVIGASSGIGLSLSKTLLEAGHEVIGTYLNTAPSLQNPNLKYYRYDVLTSEILTLETESLDGLVYCPGAINLKPFGRIKTEEFQKDYELQVLGAIKIIQHCLGFLKKGQNPSILLFSTVAVGQGLPFHSIVSSSKGAIEGLTKALAAELSPGIRVNCIAPSLTNTPLAKGLLSSEEKIQANAQRHPLKKIGQPEDIAHMAAFLLSDRAQWITGQILAVDGGLSQIKLG